MKDVSKMQQVTQNRGDIRGLEVIYEGFEVIHEGLEPIYEGLGVRSRKLR